MSKLATLAFKSLDVSIVRVLNLSMTGKRLGDDVIWPKCILGKRECKSQIKSWDKFMHGRGNSV